jgi:hypothetical protein
MDEDLIAFCAVMVLFLSFPVSVALITTSCVAYSRAKAWDKARNIKANNVETNRLVDNDDDSDFYDTDDEEEHNARKAEELAESHMTFREKWGKEFRKVWSGKGAKEIVKQREREERRKLAKAVAKELERIERRRAKKMVAQQGSETLPAYQKE